MVFSDLDQDPEPIAEDGDSFSQFVASEIDQVLYQKRDLMRKIQQSQVEVNKLARRNASITTQIQQMQAQLQTMSAADVRSAYESALDAQQRLFVMRGQLEKMEQEETTLQKYYELLERVNQVFNRAETPEKAKPGSFATVETIIRAQEDERLRLSRQMHDGPAQTLSNFILQTEIAARLFDLDQGRAREELSVLKTAATSTLQKVRDFIFELRPMMLDDLGLAPTIKRYTDAVKEHANIDIDIMVTGTERRLESYLEVVVFRSYQELLRNALNHSQGTEIRAHLDITDKEVHLFVEDNGKGFDPEVIENEQSVGLRVVRERVELVGGTFSLETFPGRGAKVIFKIPASKSPDIA